MQQQQDFHQVTACQDGIFNSFSGKLINLLSPTEDMIEIQDIAASLSKICRFGGHSRLFYSVAQHSVFVAALASNDFPKEALMHDAAEAYLGDVIKPLKVLLGAAYANLETNFEAIIAARFGLTISKGIKSRIKIYDLKALNLEHQAFIMNRLDLVKEDHYAWSPELAKTIFLTAFAQNFDNNNKQQKWSDNPAEIAVF